MIKKGKYNILHIDSFSGFGGAQADITILLEFTKKNYADKFNIFVIHNNNERLKKELDKKGINNASVRMRNFLDIFAILKIRKILKENDIDLINFHSSRDHYLAGIASILILNKKIIKVLTRHVAYNISYLKGYLIYRFLTDYFITISDFIKNILINGVKINPEKIKTIYSPRTYGKEIAEADILNYGGLRSSVRIEAGINNSEKMVSLIGRLSKEKGHLTFIMAAKEILRTRGDIKFAIIGEGELFEEISAFISENGIKNNFILLGFQGDIKKYISASDLIVVPSGLEGMGSIIIESCAMRKAVVASNAGGIPEVVRNGKTGILFEAENYKELAEKILTVVDNEDLSKSLGTNCFEEVLKKFDAKNIADETARLYLGLLGQA